MATVTKTGERQSVRYTITAGDVKLLYNPFLGGFANIDITLAGVLLSAVARLDVPWRGDTKPEVYAETMLAPIADELAVPGSERRLRAIANVWKRVNEDVARAERQLQTQQAMRDAIKPLVAELPAEVAP